jgi:small subunit ribosomal protein S20
MRQNIKRRARNRARKGQLKKTLRDFEVVAKTGDAAKTGEALLTAIQRLDRVSVKGAVHKNTAARRKSQLQRRFNALKAGAKS